MFKYCKIIILGELLGKYHKIETISYSPRSSPNMYEHVSPKPESYNLMLK